MQLLTWLLRLIIFFLFFCFAAMNSENITLHYSHESSLEIPLSVALLIFFGLGVLLTIFTAPRSYGKRK